jgi:hypothetical protein
MVVVIERALLGALWLTWFIDRCLVLFLFLFLCFLHHRKVNSQTALMTDSPIPSLEQKMRMCERRILKYVAACDDSEKQVKIQ